MSSGKLILLATFTILLPCVFGLIKVADPLCENLPADEIFPFSHEYNCSLYYECLNGNKTVFICDDGLYYNNQTQACDFPSSSGCTNGNSQCADINLDYLPHPENCSLYVECYEGNSYVMRCPEGYWFSSTQKLCVLPDESDCVITTISPFTTPDPLCIGVRPNHTVLSSYDGDCRKYWKCSGSQLSLEDCPLGFLFDEAKQLCDFPEMVSCDDSTRTPDPSTETPPPTPNVTQISPDPRCNDNEITYWPHAEDCTKYIQCYYGDSYEMNCPSGLYFSDEQKKCVVPSQSECGKTTVTLGTTSERPGDWTSDPDCPWPEGEGRLLPFPGDCTQYYECAEGQKVAMPCPSGLWFNPIDLECDYPYQAQCEYASQPSFLEMLYSYIFS